MTGSILERADNRRITRISAGDIDSGASFSSSESSPDDVSGTKSGGVRYDTVVSERVFVGSDESARRAAGVMMDVGSII